MKIANKKILAIAMAAIGSTALTGCESSGPAAAQGAGAGRDASESAPAPVDSPDVPAPNSGPAPAARTYSTDLLIYNGAGTATDDTASVVSIVGARGLSYKVATSSQLNAMSLAQLQDFGAIVWPGGVAKTMSDSLAAATRARVAEAVESGVGYVGFCAGSFIAGDYGTWGLGLTDTDFDYFHLEYDGYVKAMTEVVFADGSKRDLVWYGGPELTGFGRVVAKYDDGTPAIAQQEVGKGLVILSGPHPEAPVGWRSGLSDSDGTDFDLTFQLIQAALKGQPVATY